MKLLFQSSFSKKSTIKRSQVDQVDPTRVLKD